MVQPAQRRYSEQDILNDVYDPDTSSIRTKESPLETTNSRNNKIDNTIIITSSTSEVTLLPADANYFIDVYGLILANTSGTATEVEIRDTTGGTPRMVFMVPAGDTRGFMLPVSGAKTQAQKNKNWTVKCITSVASLKATGFAIKNS